jgi:hypothetical protein
LIETHKEKERERESTKYDNCKTSDILHRERGGGERERRPNIGMR